MALDAATSGFLWSAGLALAVSVVCIIVFSLIRNKFRDVYQYRRLIHQWKSHDDFNNERVGIPSAAPRSQPFAWISAAMSMSEDDIVTNIGLDTAMYLRYIRSMMLSFFCVSFICVVALIPMYATGEFRNPNKAIPKGVIRPENITGLRIISLANVIPKDNRMWGTLVCEILSSFIFLYFMYHDFKRFAELRRRNLYAENPKNFALAVFDVPNESNNPEDIRTRFDTILPGQISQVICVKANAKAVRLHKKLDVAVQKRELAEWISANKLNGDRPQARVGCCGMLRCWESKVDAIEHWDKEEDRLKTELIDEVSKSQYAPSAIVVFKNKRAASLLAQANMADDATQWNVERMPEPKAVHWRAFFVPGYQANVRKLGVFAFVLALTLFWTIPAFGIASLISLDSAAQQFPFLRPVLNWNAEVKGLIQGLLPSLILAVIVSLIPVVIRLVVSLERLHSVHTVDRKTRDYFYLFTVYSSFFCIVLGASILDEIKKIVANFDVLRVFDLLGSSVPAQSVFFATYICVQTGITTSLELLNPVRLILVFIFKKIAKTERQKRAAQANGCNPLMFRKYGNAMLISFVGIMYTPMAPILPVLCFVFFSYVYIVHRYNLIYNLYSDTDGAGESYPGAFWGTLLALTLKQGVLVVILAIKRSPAAPFVIIPLIMTICTGIEIGRRFRRVSMFGSLHDHMAEKIDDIPDRYIDIYEQPSVKPGESYNTPGEYINLNGVAEIDDYHENSREIPADFEMKSVDPPVAEPSDINTGDAVVDSDTADPKK